MVATKFDHSGVIRPITPPVHPAAFFATSSIKNTGSGLRFCDFLTYDGQKTLACEMRHVEVFDNRIESPTQGHFLTEPSLVGERV